MKGHPIDWESGKDARIREAVAAGVSTRAIAREFNCSLSAVQDRARKISVALEPNRNWPAETLAAAAKLWLEGYSASHIAKQISTRERSYSRNAVIGAMHRAGYVRDVRIGYANAALASRQRAPKQARPPKEVRPLKTPDLKVKQRVPSAHTAGGVLAIVDRQEQREAAKPIILKSDEVVSLNARPWEERLRGQCAWPLGESPNIHSCCNPTQDGATYCDDHLTFYRSRVTPRAPSSGQGAPKVIADNLSRFAFRPGRERKSDLFDRVA